MLDIYSRHFNLSGGVMPQMRTPAVILAVLTVKSALFVVLVT